MPWLPEGQTLFGGFLEAQGRAEVTERVLSPRPAGVAEVRPRTERGRGPEGEGRRALAGARGRRGWTPECILAEAGPWEHRACERSAGISWFDVLSSDWSVTFHGHPLPQCEIQCLRWMLCKVS